MRQVTIVAVLLAMLALPSRGFAALGCITSGSESIATCSVAADCTAVGGSECTSGFCFCETGPAAPGCPCSIRPAPAMSTAALVLLVGMLCTIAVIRMRRQARSRNQR